MNGLTMIDQREQTKRTRVQKKKQIGLLSIISLMAALLLFAAPDAHAFEAPHDNNSSMIDIRLSGTAQVQFTAGDGPNIEVSARGEGDTHFHFTSTVGTVFTVEIAGSGDANIDVSGPSELNVTVEGPSDVHIIAGDEVTVNVQADEEAQVFVIEHAEDLHDEVQKEVQEEVQEQVEELLDPDDPEGEAASEASREQVLPEQDYAAQALNPNMKIMAGLIPVIGLTSYIYLKKNKKLSGSSQRRRKT